MCVFYARVKQRVLIKCVVVCMFTEYILYRMHVDIYKHVHPTPVIVQCLWSTVRTTGYRYLAR